MFARSASPTPTPPDGHSAWNDFGGIYATNGFIGFLFAATGPLAVILSVGAKGGLSEAELSSWVFGVFFVNGLLTIALSWYYRTPLCMFWTIPGTVLVGGTLGHATFPEVVGAFFVTGAVILALGASGVAERVLKFVPMPIVMGMVAGVFLRFGLDIVRALQGDVLVAAPMIAVFLLLSAVPLLGRWLPPVLGALLVGSLAVALLGRIDAAAVGGISIAQPIIYQPEFSLPVLIELVLPLVITVVIVQNGQGLAVLKAAGHEAPLSTVAVACGIGSLLAAAVGAVSTCLTGPTNAIVASSGETRRQYTGALVVGGLALVFGILAPTFTRLMLATSKEFIMALGGLAMLRALQAAFVTSFKDRFALGALVSFLVTVADIPLFNIGAAFWGLTAGMFVSALLERRDFALERMP